jgi:ferredoxin
VKERILTRAELDRLLDELAAKLPLYAPARHGKKQWTEFRRMKSAAEIDTNRINTKKPVKGLFFPQCEVMFRFKPGSAPEEAAAIEERVVFGVRPCDAHALEVLDKVFVDPAKPDPYFRRRREAATVVGIACNEPAETCFCSGVGGSPSGTRGLDLLLVDLGSKFLARPVTPKGQKLVEKFPEAGPDDLGRSRELAATADSKIGWAADTARIKRKLDKGFESPAWETVMDSCVNCGVCTFLCPTCHCFDVTDEEHKGKGARTRVWDTCQFCIYSQHASGHNPRNARHSRWRNRVNDKFKYTVDMVGEVSCVGCGRCIIECPSNIDIRATVEALDKALPE